VTPVKKTSTVTPAQRNSLSSEWQLASATVLALERAQSEDQMQTKLFMGACLAVALVAIVGGTALATPPEPVGCAAIELPEPTNVNKVTLCHFTGSDGNPFIINEVSASAAASHSDHHGDCVNPADGPTVCVP
jgi:hypothetical protein